MKIALCLVFVAACAWAAPPTVKVRLGSAPGSTIAELPLERYVAATVAGESGAFRSDEALKAMAVAARTYAVRMRGRHSAEGFDLCNTTHCQRIDLRGITPRVERAVADTAGELLWYQGKPAFTPYAKDCGGMTEDAGAVWPDLAAPYLRTHADPYCRRGAPPPWRWNAEPRQAVQALRDSMLQTPGRLERITIATRTSSGRASTLELKGSGESIRISASSFRFAMGRTLGWNTVRSDRYEVRASSGHLVFEGTGEGHGVGLCQIGADQMGAEGKSYREILAFYYPGTTPGVTGAGLAWQTLRGSWVAVETVRPDQDRVVMTTAERLVKAVTARVRWPMPAALTIRVYPDLDTFRNGTGEPGWVSAHTSGTRIELQPVAMLRARNALESTLRHELMHVVVESQGAPGLPVWFREGVVEYLDGHATTAGGGSPDDTALRQKSDEARARAAYADAAAAVRRLVRTYGETTVLGWVKSGLPRDVMNASMSHEIPKSR